MVVGEATFAEADSKLKNGQKIKPRDQQERVLTLDLPVPLSPIQT